jgi:LacI family transcriptional regulator
MPTAEKTPKPKRARRAPVTTIKEVARKAKASVGTVSNVLTGAADVSPAMRERVLKAIKALDYHPNHVARSLKVQHTMMIGMVISDITNPFFPQVVRGAEDAFRDKGYLLTIFNTDDQADREREILSTLRRRRVDGVLLVVAPGEHGYEHITAVADSNIPVVCLDRTVDSLRLDSVLVDHEAAAEACVRRLIEMGHTKIATIAGTLRLETGQARLRGYKRAMSSAGLPVAPEWIREGDFRTHSGYVLAKQLLQLEDRPTAIFAANGLLGTGAYIARRELGVRAALAMIDDPPQAEFWSDVITMAQPAYEIGKRGAEVLLKRMSAERRPAKRETIMLSAEIRVRP